MNRLSRIDRDTVVIASVRLGIAALAILCTFLVVYYASIAYRYLQQQRVMRVYDAQQRAVAASIEEFVRELQSEGFRVINDSEGRGGSGDWRKHVAVTAEADGAAPRICYVEIQGFVSHDAADRPVWTKNLPIVISRRGQELDARFVAKVVSMIETHRWEYVVNERCRGKGEFDTEDLRKYIAP